DGPVELEVARQIHGAHASAPQLAFDGVPVAEALADFVERSGHWGWKRPSNETGIPGRTKGPGGRDALSIFNIGTSSSIVYRSYPPPYSPMFHTRILAPAIGAAACALLAVAAPAQTLDSTSIAGLKWRTVGPANFMGRMSDVVGIPSPSKTVFVAAAAG